MKSICVFCGSGKGISPEYINAAHELGRLLVKKNLDLVYGGARVGLMNEIANTVLEGGGKVTGVMPQYLVDKEVAHTGITKLHIVKDMHQRKAMLSELSDGFIAMPGGLGTLEEIFEALTWAQLGIHKKPCGFLNVNGFYDKLLDFLDHAVEQEFIKSDYRKLVMRDPSPENLLEMMRNYIPPGVDKAKWILHIQ